MKQRVDWQTNAYYPHATVPFSTMSIVLLVKRAHLFQVELDFLVFMLPVYAPSSTDTVESSRLNIDVGPVLKHLLSASTLGQKVHQP